ncbi:hypothetical protein [Bosea vaviloviae]|uniref:Uncharacterized protein n=1 Tax=Bosea vaviloviae TaxID=1526658 RepID=A0A1D7TY01_9HYPH|nr:hypothetical protein [Bosea vaviloviae]AOO80004.1 hypothetical protein BHK69_05495 [Bosea vaviloviae]
MTKLRRLDQQVDPDFDRRQASLEEGDALDPPTNTIITSVDPGAGPRRDRPWAQACGLTAQVPRRYGSFIK